MRQQIASFSLYALITKRQHTARRQTVAVILIDFPYESIDNKAAAIVFGAEMFKKSHRFFLFFFFNRPMHNCLQFYDSYFLHRIFTLHVAMHELIRRMKNSYTLSVIEN